MAQLRLRELVNVLPPTVVEVHVLPRLSWPNTVPPYVCWLDV
ncbi:MAG TPA: hypothetical protein VGG86_20195 [Roseiarcus sp.]